MTTRKSCFSKKKNTTPLSRRNGTGRGGLQGRGHKRESQGKKVARIWGRKAARVKQKTKSCEQSNQTVVLDEDGARQNTQNLVGGRIR